MVVDIKNLIKGLSREYYEEIVNIRRHFHTHPELAFEEYKTAKYICNKLTEWQIPFRDKIAKTGIVAEIKGKEKGRLIALRADMDALPLVEKNNVPYKSTNEGKMHACGHDAHMASLLGAAKILNQIKDRLPGSVRLIFQPSEESYPGGAIKMIEAGVLKDPVPVAILGQHVFPELEVGKIGMRSGKYMASTDEIHITVKGKGGHAALPQHCIDPILAGANIITSLQQIVSRNARPDLPTVVSFGRFSGEGRTNIIPDEVKLEGIVRTFDEDWRKQIHQRIRDISWSVAKASHAEAEVFVDPGYPYLYNDPDLTETSRKFAKDYLGEDNVEELDVRMTAEDFAYFAREIPACFYRLGIANKAKNITSNLHSATFDIDESSLETGMGTMAWLTFKHLTNYQE